MQDRQEFVVKDCLHCIYKLCDEQLLPKSLICDLMKDIVSFLVHPNKWLRVATVNILTILDSTFCVSDFYCKLTPIIKPLLKTKLIRFNNKFAIYTSLVEPISRQIWNYLIGIFIL